MSEMLRYFGFEVILVDLRFGDTSVGVLGGVPATSSVLGTLSSTNSGSGADCSTSSLGRGAGAG